MFLRRCLRWCCWRDRADLGQTAARFMPVLCSRRPSVRPRFKGKPGRFQLGPYVVQQQQKRQQPSAWLECLSAFARGETAGKRCFVISGPKCHGAALKSSQCKMFSDQSAAEKVHVRLESVASKDRSFTVNAAKQNMKRSDARLCVYVCGFGSFFVCVSHGRLFLVCLL